MIIFEFIVVLMILTSIHYIVSLALSLLILFKMTDEMLKCLSNSYILFIRIQIPFISSCTIIIFSAIQNIVKHAEKLVQNSDIIRNNKINIKDKIFTFLILILLIIVLFYSLLFYNQYLISNYSCLNIFEDNYAKYYISINGFLLCMLIIYIGSTIVVVIYFYRLLFFNILTFIIFCILVKLYFQTNTIEVYFQDCTTAIFIILYILYIIKLPFKLINKLLIVFELSYTIYYLSDNYNNTKYYIYLSLYKIFLIK